MIQETFLNHLHAQARRLGLDLVGIAPARSPADHVQAYEEWLARGDHGEMAYMARPEDPLQPYGGSTGGTMAAGSVQIDPAGSGQPVDNMPPYLVLRFVIALQGIFPSRS